MTDSQPALVSVSALHAMLGEPRLVLLEVKMKPVGAGATAAPESPPERIPGARVFDLEGAFSDHAQSLPHMMPGPEQFEREARKLGIHRDSLVVVYDRVGLYSSPRAWWMFKAMGHERVAVLDGGLPAWLEAGHPTSRDAEPVERPGDFVAVPTGSAFCDAAAVERTLTDASRAVIDARSRGRFEGREPEPRAGLRQGHMPNAVNVPFTEVQVKGRLKSAEELRALFEETVGSRRKFVFSCGSGVTACVDALAATVAGYTDIQVYDGSWSEWGLPSDRPVIQTS
ncbi:sulfurtransferase [Pyxidicoccus fallax]|uniref:Sulfurtransferase n=1 Tax=Pyxidicoccus fallax TaxID=394095 RepID=A0A848LEG9_9BACT|nr:sulfurtransferase [Pyxidicoccus fallax]NMO16856.1 sulfurtransferase [Pyxidicoccus fallax]NPC83042.1 sulfurtransferase [Pyxidicoccus fallax]